MPDASLVLQRYRVFFLAFLKLHFPELNTTHRQTDHKADNPHISRYYNAVCGFSRSIPSPGDRRRNRKYNSVHSQHIYQD
ncbi:Uncharacterised protein [Escherichia coli]|nr:Uncharacterised protein [Escherichia coli]